MEGDAARLADPADGADRVDRAHLVVGEHDRDEGGSIGDRLGDRSGIDPAVFVARDDRQGEPVLTGEPAERVEHGPMLDARTDEVILPLGLLREGGSLEREVVGLGRPGGEDDLRRLGPDQRGNLFPSRVDRVARLPAETMGTAGGVAEPLGEERQHGRDDPRVDPGCRVVVQVDRRFVGHGSGLLVRRSGRI